MTSNNSLLPTSPTNIPRKNSARSNQHGGADSVSDNQMDPGYIIEESQNNSVASSRHLKLSAAVYNESLRMEDRVYMRWDNINYFVPAKKRE